MTNPIGATIDPAWAKKYLNLNTSDFFYKYPPKLPKNVGFMARKCPKMADNGTGSPDTNIAKISIVLLYY
jgi:hypothetical protein